MALVPINNLAQYGIIKDVQDFLLPVNAWTDARNVRFRDEGVVSIGGTVDLFEPITVTPYWNMHVFSAEDEGIWIYAGLTKVRARFSSSTVDITRTGADYTAVEGKPWNGGVLGGIPILNNGVDVPQQWAPISLGQKLVNLQNWPANWRAAVIRPFKNFLIAMNLIEDSTNFIHRVRTSHPAVPGAVPSSWDAIDPTVDATRFDFSDVNSGHIVDGAGLRDVFVVGKEKALHGMQFIGGTSKFRNFVISETSGVIAGNCIVPDPDGLLLFIATGTDIVVCDGLKIRSLLEKRVRRWLQNNIDDGNYGKSFCVLDEINRECWFCFPTSGSSWPNLALVWNKVDNSISIREIGSLSYASGGVLPSDTLTWDQITESWEEINWAWNEPAHQAFLRPLVGADPVHGKLLGLDSGGSTPISYFERTGLSIVGVGSDGSPVSDPTRRKLIKRVYADGIGLTSSIRVSTQAKIGDPVVWSSPRSFGLNFKIAADFHQQGVLWGLRFESVEKFELSRIVVEVEDVGGAF